MASRILTRALLPRVAIPAPAIRNLTTSAVRNNAAVAGAVPLPARKPVGALRGGLFGFFFGSTLAGAGVYYYAVQEYKTSNELLTEDIYALQHSVERLSEYITAMEQKMELLEKKKR